MDVVLVSLNARKAFAFVSHSYSRATLLKYGFCQNFVNYFNKYRRGVNQGDALSCAIFILYIGQGGNWIELKQVNTKELQSILKVALGKISSQDHNAKLGIVNFDKENKVKFRSKCKNTKLSKSCVIQNDIR